MKAIAEFKEINGGGSYELSIILSEKATENQKNWLSVNKKVVWDYELQGVIADLKKDKFKIIISK